VLDTILAYNFPFFIWSGFVFLEALLDKNISIWTCPVQNMLGWCPGCGLTGSYLKLIKYGTIDNGWFMLVFTLFIFNFLWSMMKAVKIYNRPNLKAGRIK
jgi:hypothetical protein